VSEADSEFGTSFFSSVISMLYKFWLNKKLFTPSTYRQKLVFQDPKGNFFLKTRLRVIFGQSQ